MIKTICATLHESDIEEFIDGDSENRAECVKEIFEALDEAESGELLAYFCINDRETYNGDPSICYICMDNATCGTIDVDFTGSAFYGCKDMNRTDEHSETIFFEVSIKEQKVLFITHPPDPPERSFDEEF